jgi:hypothetical protein
VDILPKNRVTRPKQSSKAAIVEKMIKKFEEKLESAETKVTVGDYIRLVQFQDELEAGEPKEIKVTWVEPTEKEPVTGT